jgi:hypothetical protein
MSIFSNDFLFTTLISDDLKEIPLLSILVIYVHTTV